MELCIWFCEWIVDQNWELGIIREVKENPESIKIRLK